MVRIWEMGYKSVMCSDMITISDTTTIDLSISPLQNCQPVNCKWAKWGQWSVPAPDHITDQVSAMWGPRVYESVNVP